METVISLHGKRSGFIKIQHTLNGGLLFKSRGIPEGCKIYAVSGSVPYPINEPIPGKICGIIVTNNSGAIIMEGRERMCLGTNEAAKKVLFSKMNAQKSTAIQPVSRSAALADILERAKTVFAENTQYITADAQSGDSQDEDKKQKSTETKRFNPFSASYPDSSWKRINHRCGRGYHLEGTAYISGEKLQITAIPTYLFSEDWFNKNGYTKITSSASGINYRMRIKHDCT